MSRSNTLASAALIGLLTAGTLVAQPAFAGDDKAACSGKSGCNGTQAEKSECKGKDANSCSGKEEGDKAECKGTSGCAGKDGK